MIGTGVVSPMANEILRIQNINRVLQVASKLFLDYGIENVTKEMIADASGLSRKSIDRYFANKTDIVIRVTEWILSNIRDGWEAKYPPGLFTDGEHTGADIMRMYMADLKKLFFNDPRLFVLYSEFRAYIYRNCEDFDQSYGEFWNMMGGHRLRGKIYALAHKDGTIPHYGDFRTEEAYFCNSFLGFFSNLAVSFNQHSRDEIERQIDRYADSIFAWSTNTISQETE
jgi:AcrR family transcriptional regulator